MSLRKVSGRNVIHIEYPYGKAKRLPEFLSQLDQGSKLTETILLSKKGAYHSVTAAGETSNIRVTLITRPR